MASADGADGHQADTKGLEDNSPTTISGAAAPPGGAKAFLLTNRSLAVGLLVVVIGLAASIWFSDWAHERVRDGFTLGGFPLFAVAAMALSLLVMIFDGQARDTTPEMRRVSPLRLPGGVRRHCVRQYLFCRNSVGRLRAGHRGARIRGGPRAWLWLRSLRARHRACDQHRPSPSAARAGHERHRWSTGVAADWGLACLTMRTSPTPFMWCSPSTRCSGSCSAWSSGSASAPCRASVQHRR